MCRSSCRKYESGLRQSSSHRDASRSLARSVMRCILPQALWPEAPPEHAVTCILASSAWHSVWTGAADGGILSWRVEGDVFDLNEGTKDGHAQKVRC